MSAHNADVLINAYKHKASGDTVFISAGQLLALARDYKGLLAQQAAIGEVRNTAIEAVNRIQDGDTIGGVRMLRSLGRECPICGRVARPMGDHQACAGPHPLTPVSDAP